MKYIEAPEIHTWKNQSLFIAGWISWCPDWQKEYINYFRDTSLAVLNPRRTDFNIEDKSVEIEQITWEHEHLEKADIISFWFGKETICPIVLYELGKYANSNKEIYVWVDPAYERKSDVEIQMDLVRPNLQVVNSLKDLANQILKTL